MDWVVAHKLAMRLSAPPRQYFSGLNIAWVAMADYAGWSQFAPASLGTKNSGILLDEQHYHTRMPTSINKHILNCRLKHRLIGSHLRIQSGAMNRIKWIDWAQEENDGKHERFNA